MTTARFVLAMAWRESRASLRRLSLLMASVSVGVGALVAINSFTHNLRGSVREQARALLGADLFLGSANPFSPRAEAVVLDLVEKTPGTRLSRLTRFAAMAYVPRTSGSRLVQVTAVEGGYPYYGLIETDPPGEWERLSQDRGALVPFQPVGRSEGFPDPPTRTEEVGTALVDASLLNLLDARVGDTLALGEARFGIHGTVVNVPGDVGVRAALGPRVFIAGRHVPETRLLAFGARARYEVYLKLPAGADPERLARRHRSSLAAERIVFRTVSEDRENLNLSLGRLGRYLGLVALIALLLGGVGVASAVHVFIKRKIETIAVLRCLGATSRTLLSVYLVQAAAMGLAGSLIGAALGVSLQVLLPGLLKDFLPVDVSFAPAWSQVVAGIGIGLGVTGMFSVPPLLGVRHVSPLAVLRRPYEEAAPRPRDLPRLVAVLALAGSVVALASWQSASLRGGLAFSAGIGVALLALWLAALALIRAIRRHFPSGWPYVWRQGIANLYRPANQTVTVVLALGFGAFLLDTLYLVQHNLLRDLRPGGDADRPNLVLFDIQPDQRGPVFEELRKAGFPHSATVPVVPMRIQSVKGTPAASLLAHARPGGLSGIPNPWTLRREYRSTYRDGLTATERRVDGNEWAKGSWRGWRDQPNAPPVPISMEVEVARELGVGIGDEIVWDVQGVALTTRVASLREVKWARFEPNFFVVFPEGPLDQAPQSFVTLTRIDDLGARARMERRIVEAFPNVTALDLSQVQQAVDQIVGRVAKVIRFMALFSMLAGGFVLLGAVATSRYQRVREAVLLKALGATRGQILLITLAEYGSLGSLGATTALLLSVGSGWALVHFVFESPFALPGGPLAILALVIVGLTVAVGLGHSLELFRRTPLEVLRAE